MFISFEGPEGCGKSTQTPLVAALLRQSGLDVVETREPGGTELGEALRSILLGADHAPAPATEAYLMTAARAEHVRQVIRPALERGDWVLCDRYVDSTFAYQGAGRGLDIARLRELQSLATDGLLPDCTVLLDLEVVDGLRRRQTAGSRNRIDDEEVSFHQRVAGWYRAEAAGDPARWRVIDADQPIEEVTRRIMKILPIVSGQRTFAP